MKTPFIVLLCVLSAHSAWSKPKYGPEGKSIAAPISRNSSGITSSSDYWALSAHYVPQFNGAACSVASLAAVLNAARDSTKLTSDDKNILQEDLLKKVSAEHWSDRIESKLGWKGEHGITLDPLANVVKAAFEEYGFKNVKVRAVHADKIDYAFKQKVRQDLIANESSRKNFIIANFLQSKFTDDSDAGHISPVGAFDAAHDRVLIMDVDREWYEPYWVSLDAFLYAMNTFDKSANKNRGYIFVDF